MLERPGNRHPRLLRRCGQQRAPHAATHAGDRKVDRHDYSFFGGAPGGVVFGKVRRSPPPVKISTGDA